MSPRTFTLLLAMTPGIGGKTIVRIVARNNLLQRAPEEFLRLPTETWREEYRITSKATQELDARRRLAPEVKALESRLAGLGVTWTTAADAGYPETMESFDPDPPGVVFLYGNHRLLKGPTFSVLASRGSTPSDLDRIERATEAGVLAGEVVVSGHDRPEYQRSAVVPLRWGAPRILCFDRGLFRVLGENLKDEAFRAARLWRYEFDPSTDLAISPFRPDADFIGVNNKVRDRLVAGLSRRIDFVHIGIGGGMERLLNLAMKAGRPVRIASSCPNVEAVRDRGVGVFDP